MEVVDALKHGELGEQAQRAFQAARETVVNELVPASTDRLRDLAERVDVDRYLEQVKELERDYAKRAKKIERKLEKRAKKLPVDTPLDRHRRQRSRRRGAKGGMLFVVFAAVAGAIAWAIWRSRRPEELETLQPDSFGSSSDNGEDNRGEAPNGEKPSAKRPASPRATGSKQRTS